MLPGTLLCLLNVALVLAQSRQQLSLNSLSIFNSTTLPNPPSFSLPNANRLSISVALCPNSSSLPKFFVTNGTDTSIPGPGGGNDVYEITIDKNGYGQFTGLFRSGGVFAVDNAGQTPFEIGVSDSGVMHELLVELPLLGDTTANQVLLFSPPFASAPDIEEPIYPNYTLPEANSSLPTPPTAPNFSLVIVPATSSPMCVLNSQASTGSIASQSTWLRDDNGWRTQWIVEGLSPQTNYTAYVIQDSTKLSGPIYFVTKSAQFSCPLVSSLPYCPGIAYAVPLSPPTPPSPAFYDASSIPSNISSLVVEYLTNFTTVLTSFACGRDMYSPVQTCSSCQKEYRKWLCAISFTRCSEASIASGFSTSQAPLSALLPQETSASPRNPTFPNFPTTYNMLLPCIETCNAVDRACPNFLGFRCPTTRFNAQSSYGVGFIDSFDGETEDGGIPGSSQDQWGNVWCNAG